MLYTEIFDNIPGAGCSLEDWNTTYEGCKCNAPTHKCNIISECTCLNHLKEPNYILENNHLILNLPLFRNDLYPINECSFECQCIDCNNRVVQNGPRFQLEIFHTLNKGTGLRSRELIPRGSFVIEYLGELLGVKEAELLLEQRKLEPNYIMFLREHYSNMNSKTVVIDAKNYSNKGRFINHSCEPNLIVLPVRIDNVIPHASLFATRDIQALEELSYDYNQSEDYNETVNDSNLKKCFCNSVKCRQYLPNTKL